MADGQRRGPLSHHRGYSQSLMLQMGAAGDTSNPTGPPHWPGHWPPKGRQIQTCHRLALPGAVREATHSIQCHQLDHGHSAHILPHSGLQRGGLLLALGRPGAKGTAGIKGQGTHRAVSPARQDPEVVDLAIQLQPAGNREGKKGREEALEGVMQQLQGSLPSQSPWRSQSHMRVSLPIATAVHSSGQSHSNFGFTSSCRGRAGCPQSMYTQIS